jgi:hypothetical protein
MAGRKMEDHLFALHLSAIQSASPATIIVLQSGLHYEP